MATGISSWIPVDANSIVARLRLTSGGKRLEGFTGNAASPDGNQGNYEWIPTIKSKVDGKNVGTKYFSTDVFYPANIFFHSYFL